MDAIKRAVGRKFRTFLTKFVDPSTGALVYQERITTMCAQNRESLEVRFGSPRRRPSLTVCAAAQVKFVHLAKHCAILAIYIIDAPTEMLEIFDRVARLVVLRSFPNYDAIHPQIHVRVQWGLATCVVLIASAFCHRCA